MMKADKPNFTASGGIETPCIKVCKIDEVSRLCTGCGRSLAEIAQWGSMTSTERRAIMTDLPRRLAAT
jgi:uncharacterized protein